MNLNYYGDWIKYFQSVREKHVLDDLDLKKAKLLDKKHSYGYWIKELVNLINSELNFYIESFISNISLYSDKEENLIHAFYLTQSKIDKLYFFNQLKFIDKKQINELNYSLDENVNNYLLDLINGFNKQNNGQFNDFVYTLNKVFLKRR